jgi:hypothetical protein
MLPGAKPPRESRGRTCLSGHQLRSTARISAPRDLKIPFHNWQGPEACRIVPTTEEAVGKGHHVSFDHSNARGIFVPRELHKSAGQPCFSHWCKLELLKLRGGPGLGYNVILGLPDGTVVLRRDCTTELGELWCRVSLAAAPSVTGFVAARYLSDARF